MATGPQLATTPLEVLSKDRIREPPFTHPYWIPALGATFCFLTVVMTNWFIRRPLMAGIQNHVLATAAGGGIGKYVDNVRNDYLAERDAAFRHYIQLHPEDFPPFPRKKYSEVFEPWVPIR